MSFESIIGSLTELGAAPTLLYDDDGHFAIGDEGTQNVLHDKPKDKETTFIASWWIKPNGWKDSIREALYFYLDLLGDNNQ